MFGDIINYELKDIIVSGYSEKQENFYLFSPMYWWIYLQFDNFYIVLDSNSGHITTKIADKIECYLPTVFITIEQPKLIRNIRV